MISHQRSERLQSEFAILSESRSVAVDALHAATAIYTATEVVRSLLQRANWPHRGGRLIDPSAGDGAFMVEALAMLDLSAEQLLESDRVVGMEIHPDAVGQARERLESFYRAKGCCSASARAAARRNVIEGDFLVDQTPSGPFSVIAGNPPYLRFGFVPAVFQELYRKTVPEHAIQDMQHAFLDKCSRLLAPGGALAFVTSDRWLFNSTAASLRRALGEHVGLAHVARLDASTSFYRPKRRTKGSPPRIHPVEVVLESSALGIRPLTAAPICPDDGSAMEPSSSGQTLADIALVRLAPWLGPFGQFVVDQQKADIVRRSACYISAGADLVPAVDTDDIDPESETLRCPSRYAIRTLRGKEPIGLIGEHLRSVASAMPARKGQRPYWMPPETITLPIDRPALLIPRIARSLRAVPLPAGVLPVNHNLSVVSCQEDFGLERLRAILLSESSQAWIRKHAPRLENGYLSITTSLLRRLPV